MDAIDYGRIVEGPSDIILWLFIGLLLTYHIVRFFNKYSIRGKTIFLLLITYHFFFAFAYWNNTLCEYEDSNLYYEHALNGFYGSSVVDYLRPGTAFITLLLLPLVQGLHLSYFSCFMLFSFFGFWGFLFLFKTFFELGGLKGLKIIGFILFPTLLFLPNLHIWTVAIGKDSLIFCALTAIFYALIRIKGRWLLLSIATIFVFMIRPHIFLVLGISLLIVLTMENRKKLSVYFGLIPAGLGVLFFGANYFLVKIIGRGSIWDMYDILEEKSQTYASVYVGTTGSGIDMTTYSIPIKMFTYLFRPFFESLSPTWIVASIENLVLLILSLSMTRPSFIKWLKKSHWVIKAMLLYAFLGVMLLSFTSSNFGIMVRQKTMFVFVLFICPLLFYSDRRRTMNFRKNG